MYLTPSCPRLIILGLPIVAGGIILAPQIITLVFGAKYLGGALALQILMGALLVIHISNPFVSALFAGNFQKTTFWVTAGGAFLNAILNLILIPKYTLNGAAFATLVTYLVDMVAMIVWQKIIRKLLFSAGIFEGVFGSNFGHGIDDVDNNPAGNKKFKCCFIVLFGAFVYGVAALAINKIFKLKLF